MGSDPEVQRRPELWAREDNLDEISQKHREAWRPAFTTVRADDTGAPRVVTTKLRARRAIRLELDDDDPREVKKGELLDLDDPLGVLAPHLFERVEVEDS